jgi:hypothetical protein
MTDQEGIRLTMEAQARAIQQERGREQRRAEHRADAEAAHREFMREAKRVVELGRELNKPTIAQRVLAAVEGIYRRLK